MKKLLEIKNFSIGLKKDNKAIVKNLNFDLDAGSSLILLGESGSGKTLTCKSILGVLNAGFVKTGEILFQGGDLSNRKLYGKEIAMIAQNPMTAFDPSAKIGRQMDETLRIHMKLSRSESYNKCVKALNHAGLSNADTVMGSYPFMLSGGMLQRVMIAIALMMDSRLIIADEPTTALDVQNRNSTIDSFIRLRKGGAAILLVTHDFMVATRFGGNILIMKDGEIIERGLVTTIINKPQHPYTKELILASRLSDSEREDDVYA